LGYPADRLAELRETPSADIVDGLRSTVVEIPKSTFVIRLVE
jgi:hypothetical protein